MGSATTQALDAVTAALSHATDVDLATARELFDAARALGGSTQLSGALADPAASTAARAQLVTSVFGGAVSSATVNLLKVAAEQRWSSPDDFVDAVEELGVRAAAKADSADVEGELFEVSRVVAANPELELALGSRLGEAAKKGELVSSILDGKVSDATALIVASLVRQPGNRRVRQLLTRAMRVVADERGRTVATVFTAAPLTEAQSTRLTTLLSERYGREVSINEVIESSVVGGLRIQVADDIIDASVAARLADLRHRLAG